MNTSLIISDVDVIINVVEINDRHGVGILLKRIFKQRSQIISIRTLNVYQGEQSFGIDDVLLGKGSSRSKILAEVERALAGWNVRRILCIPYHIEEIFAALAVRELFGAEICTYLMDDQNVLFDGIPDDLMSELLSKSGLCLAISPEMRDVYQAKYSIPIYFAPPVIPAALANHHHDALPCDRPDRQKLGAIFGNVWSPKWLELLRAMTRESGIQLDWYGNTGADWNFSDRERLSNDGIIERGFLPTEADVVAVLQNYAYVIVPSGTLDLQDDNSATAWLSLPSRIPFILATTNTPIIVLGNQSTAAARFVTRFGLGTSADYDPVSFKAAVDYVTQESVRASTIENAVKIAPQFINEQMDEWIWQSLALGKPVDDRFEALLTAPSDYTTAFTACLNIIREQQVEIDRLKFRFKLFSSPMQYIQELSHRWQPLRRIWLRLKGQF